VLRMGLEESFKHVSNFLFSFLPSASLRVRMNEGEE